jgi:hypothetical protein
MALVFRDRVRETTVTTGTGTVTLAGAASGFQSFSAIGDGNTTYYVIALAGTSEWEVGVGTYTSSGTTLSRDTVLASSNSGSLVSFSAGTKDVWCYYPAGRAVIQDTSNTGYAPQLNATNGLFVNSLTVSANYDIPSGSSAMSTGPITVSGGVTVTVPSGSKWIVL